MTFTSHMPIRLIATLLAGVLAATAPAVGRTTPTSYHMLPVGTHLTYKKSNRDGSDVAHVELYVASPSRINVLKWTEDGTDFVEVEADLDSKRRMPVVMQQWNTAGGIRRSTLWAHVHDGVFEIRNTDAARFQIPLSRNPLHVWGFDLMSLAALRPRSPQDGTFTLDIVDPNRPGTHGRPFAQGEVTFSLEGDDVLDGVLAHRYRIEGPVFGDTVGHVWFSADTGLLQRAEHEVPTSTDWQDWRLELSGQGRLDGLEWEARIERLAERQRAQGDGTTPAP